METLQREALHGRMKKEGVPITSLNENLFVVRESLRRDPTYFLNNVWRIVYTDVNDGEKDGGGSSASTSTPGSSKKSSKKMVHPRALTRTARIGLSQKDAGPDAPVHFRSSIKTPIIRIGKWPKVGVYGNYQDPKTLDAISDKTSGQYQAQEKKTHLESCDYEVPIVVPQEGLEWDEGYRDPDVGEFYKMFSTDLEDIRIDIITDPTVNINNCNDVAGSNKCLLSVDRESGKKKIKQSFQDKKPIIRRIFTEKKFDSMGIAEDITPEVTLTTRVCWMKKEPAAANNTADDTSSSAKTDSQNPNDKAPLYDPKGVIANLDPMYYYKPISLTDFRNKPCEPRDRFFRASNSLAVVSFSVCDTVRWDNNYNKCGFTKYFSSGTIIRWGVKKTEMAGGKRKNDITFRVPMLPNIMDSDEEGDDNDCNASSFYAGDDIMERAAKRFESSD